MKKFQMMMATVLVALMAFAALMMSASIALPASIDFFSHH